MFCGAPVFSQASCPIKQVGGRVRCGVFGPLKVCPPPDPIPVLIQLRVTFDFDLNHRSAGFFERVWVWGPQRFGPPP